MRISCWSSDVCSSDLPTISQAGPWLAGGSVRRLIMCLPQDSDFDFFFKDQAQFDAFCDEMKLKGAERVSENDFNKIGRASCRERCVSTCRSRWSQYP